MQITNGIRSILSIGWVYNLFQNMVGGEYARKWIVENVWKVKNGDVVIDIGCGPGTAVPSLPKDLFYFGYDISEVYINAAQKKYKENYTFCCGSADKAEKEIPKKCKQADVILTNGVLHHLDDDIALKTLKFAKNHLKPNGRFVSIEPVFLKHQTRLSRWLVGKDRGQNVRTEEQWKELIGAVFTNCSTNILTGLIRIPYVHICVEAKL
jgi:SAM-dependent methyltransferase